jgi:hypothetical protein
MFIPIQYLMPFGCSRWLPCAIIPSIHHIRQRTRHGYGSLHNCVSVGFPGLRMAPVLDHLPGFDQLGSR